MNDFIDDFEDGLLDQRVLTSALAPQFMNLLSSLYDSLSGANGEGISAARIADEMWVLLREDSETVSPFPAAVNVLQAKRYINSQCTDYRPQFEPSASTTAFPYRPEYIMCLYRALVALADRQSRMWSWNETQKLLTRYKKTGGKNQGGKRYGTYRASKERTSLELIFQRALDNANKGSTRPIPKGLATHLALDCAKKIEISAQLAVNRLNNLDGLDSVKVDHITSELETKSSFCIKKLLADHYFQNYIVGEI